MTRDGFGREELHIQNASLCNDKCLLLPGAAQYMSAFGQGVRGVMMQGGRIQQPEQLTHDTF